MSRSSPQNSFSEKRASLKGNTKISCNNLNPGVSATDQKKWNLGFLKSPVKREFLVILTFLVFLENLLIFADIKVTPKITLTKRPRFQQKPPKPQKHLNPLNPRFQQKPPEP